VALASWDLEAETNDLGYSLGTYEDELVKDAVTSELSWSRE
jgi:hypothetical protein